MSDFKRIDISLYQSVSVRISHIRGNSPIAGSRPADSLGIRPDGGEASCFTISLIVRVPTSYELEMDGREHDRGSDGEDRPVRKRAVRQDDRAGKGETGR